MDALARGGTEEMAPITLDITLHDWTHNTLIQQQTGVTDTIDYISLNFLY